VTDFTSGLNAWRAAPQITLMRQIEFGATLLILLLLSQALLGPLLASEAEPEGAMLLRVMWLPIYAVAAIWMVARPGISLDVARRIPIILALSFLCLVSFVWSIDSAMTMRRGFALLMTTAIGIAFAATWSWRDLTLLIATSFTILGLGSAIAAIIAPGFAVHSDIHVGAWKGLWWEKNTLGAMMAFGAAACFAAAAQFPRYKLIWWGIAAFHAGMVLMSTSKTALVALLIAVAGAMGIALVRRGIGFATLMLFLAGVLGSSIALIVTLAPLAALEALGRDATLTGRTDIWAVLFGQIAAAPWTGYGYGAYWTQEYGPVFWVRQQTQWPVPTAHNGWLEIALAIGLPGVAMMALSYLLTLFRAITRLFRGRETYWALVFVVMLGVISFSESNLLQRNGLTWVLFVATAAKLAMPRRA
jgi:exopolysaccharide production protein ExoQ